MKCILITGASGRVGAHLVRRLAGEPVALRLLVRATPSWPVPAGAELVFGDYNDPAHMAKAFSSIDAAFMYAPANGASDAVFQTAAKAGVRELTLLSSASVTRAPPGLNPIAERHRAAENAAHASGLDCTFIRPDTMASNCLQWAQGIREERRVYAAYPESMRNPIHEDDIALLAAQSLRDASHAGCAFDVTGPASLTVREQVECIAALLGTDLECVAIPNEEALQRMTAPPSGLPHQAAARLLDYQQKSVTVPPHVSDDFQRATGRAPRRFEEWVRDNLDTFRSQPSLSGR